jgi:hypothetical protein
MTLRKKGRKKAYNPRIKHDIPCALKKRYIFICASRVRGAAQDAEDGEQRPLNDWRGRAIACERYC